MKIEIILPKEISFNVDKKIVFIGDTPDEYENDDIYDCQLTLLFDNDYIYVDYYLTYGPGDYLSDYLIGLGEPISPENFIKKQKEILKDILKL